jgi:hypothetical protein
MKYTVHSPIYYQLEILTLAVLDAVLVSGGLDKILQADSKTNG